MCRKTQTCRRLEVSSFRTAFSLATSGRSVTSPSYHMHFGSQRHRIPPVTCTSDNSVTQSLLPHALQIAASQNPSCYMHFRSQRHTVHPTTCTSDRSVTSPSCQMHFRFQRHTVPPATCTSDPSVTQSLLPHALQNVASHSPSCHMHFRSQRHTVPPATCTSDRSVTQSLLPHEFLALTACQSCSELPV